jgi:phospholipid/cholesterol/gamma-HCH transport system substrate-binding protein
MTTSAGGRALLGLLIAAVVGVLGYGGTRLAQGAFEDDYRISVVLGETGQGIVPGSDVVARGVIVGEVGRISLDEDLQAVVELILDNRYTVPEDSTFAVTGKTLLGEKQIEIVFEGPFDAERALAEQTVVDDPDRVVELQDVLQSLDELFAAVDPEDLAVVVDDGLGTFVGQEDAIARAVDQGARATNVFSRSLDDQILSLRDLSLVAEALGPAGEEFNRLGQVIDGGALDTLTANQDRLRVLLASLDRFSDQLDVTLELTRPDLDRLIVEGDNVTRLLFTYRPEVGELLRGIADYTELIGTGGLTDPGFTGFGAGFQIIIDPEGDGEGGNPFCGEAPPELTAAIPICAGQQGSTGEPGAAPAGDGGGAGPDGGGGAPAPAPVPLIPDPQVLLTFPGTASGAPETGRSGLEAVLDGLLPPSAEAAG